MILFTIGFGVFYFRVREYPDAPSLGDDADKKRRPDPSEETPSIRARGGRHFISGRLLNRVPSLDLKMLKALGLTAVLAAVFLLPFTYKLFAAASSPVTVEAIPGRGAGLLKTTIDELLALSSRPWDFFVPSEHHPIFGRLHAELCGWLAKNSGGFETQCTHYPWERNIYLGWVGLLLSGYALLQSRKSRADKRWIWVFAVLTALMVWTSFPAFMNIKGHRLYFPSYLLHRFTSMFRTYARLGVVVLLGVAVLAGFGLKFIFERIKKKPLFTIYYLLFTILILFDFTNIPPLRVTEIPTPPVYQWLKEQPGDFLIAEYPQPYSEVEAMFFQRIHQKKMVAVTKDLAALYDPSVVGKLRDLGVKYVLVHVTNVFPSDPYNTNRTYQIMSPPKETENFKIVKQFDEVVVYEVL
jgi:hypothetical protein